MCTGGFISAKQTGHSSSFLVNYYDDDGGANDEEYDDGDGDSGSLKIKIPGEHHDDDRIYDDWQHFQTEAKIPNIGPIELLMLVKPIYMYMWQWQYLRSAGQSLASSLAVVGDFTFSINSSAWRSRSAASLEW